MANSAFRISEGKKYESTFGECSGSVFTVNQSNHDDVTKISDIMDIHYESGVCPVVGDIVRWSSVNNALTLADAEYNPMSDISSDPEASSEVIGVIEEIINACGPENQRAEASARVVFFGKIDFANHMGNKSLTPGKVYYLNDSTEQDHNHPEGHVFRNGTSREPAVVSKPVYIATSPTTAVVTNFRGLMGGQRDFVIDEILLEVDCDDVGFLVSIKNNGSETWKTPIDTILDQYDAMDGSTSVGSVTRNWGSYTDLGIWNPSTDPMLQTGTLSLTPGSSVHYRVGTTTDVKSGKLNVLLQSNSTTRASASKQCVPIISVISECADETANPVIQLPRFLISWQTSSSRMSAPITYTVQEKNDSGEYEDVQQDNTNFQLPSSQNESVWYVDVYDKFNPTHSGDYRIIFPDIIEGHWAYNTLKDGFELSCIKEMKCECDETPNCLIEPRDIEKRKTYGPVETAFELDGTTEVGSAKNNPTKYPGLYIDQPVDVTSEYDVIESKSLWLGSTSRTNEDGTNGRFCGTTVESGDYYSLNFTFTIPNDGALCVPKLTPDKIKAGAPYRIEIWKNRTTYETGFGGLFSMSIGDVPKEPATATVFINYDETTGQYENCFDITIDGASREYFIDEMVT